MAEPEVVPNPQNPNPPPVQVVRVEHSPALILIVLILVTGVIPGLIIYGLYRLFSRKNKT